MLKTKLLWACLGDAKIMRILKQMDLIAKNMSNLFILDCFVLGTHGHWLREASNSSILVHLHSQKRPGLKIETGPILMGF
ncbi:MAG: hypothetical protein NWQ53_07605, partial [Flavobacteriales bacterium]|nr:hypothetical protein [Flavobacteriales bacterium]